MKRRRPSRTAAERERRARRAAAVRLCRARQRQGKMVLPLEADDTTFSMMETFGGLDRDRIHDRQTVTNALAKLVRLAFGALLRERAGRR
jgi:hypothetical protein